MTETMTVGEFLLALAVIAVFAGLAAMAYRTRSLSKGGNMAVLAMKFPRGNWRTGMVRYRNDRLEWFTFRSLTFRPEQEWQRGDFVLGSRRQLDHGDRPRAMTGDAVAVDVECGTVSFQIAMAPGDYTALRSWSESAPPGTRTELV